jgi:sRNA-binding carbon storage regulator CsrA
MPSKTGGLVLTRKNGEAATIIVDNKVINVRLIEGSRSNNQQRIMFETDHEDIKIYREEIVKKILSGEGYER